MEDVLRRLYEGEYRARLTFKPKNEMYQRINAESDAMSEKMASVLKEHGVDDAEDLVSEWMDAWFTLTNEELIISFKRGVRLGFQISSQIQNEE